MIIVECRNDQLLVFRMSFTREQVRHAHNKPGVLRSLDEQKYQAVGVVDKDPRAGEHPSVKQQYDEKNAKGGIRLLTRRDGDRKSVIEISPRLEDWLYVIAKRNRISPERFGLPTDPEGLHSMSLALEKNMPNFQRFLDELRKTEDDEINTLREWIREAIAE